MSIENNRLVYVYISFTRYSRPRRQQWIHFVISRNRVQQHLFPTTVIVFLANFFPLLLRVDHVGKSDEMRETPPIMPTFVYFTGWLTSVPFQPTHAYCKYCKKNLHAHRLSLLKHTCTMKHQRSALQHKEENSENKGDVNAPEIGYIEEVETDMNESQEGFDQENEDEEIEYVVERLDDDEILENQEVNEENKDIEMTKSEEIYVQKEVDDLCAQLQSDEDDSKLVLKKVKLPEEKCRDPLAQAMAHVHSEYLDEEGEEVDNVEMEVEMVVETTNSLTAVSDKEETLTETYEGAEVVQEVTANKKFLRKSQEDTNVDSVPASSSVILSSRTEPINFETVTSKIDNPNKTVTLMCGSKTFTLSGGSFQPGTQYVLTKLQNKPTTNDPKMKTITVTEIDKTKLPVALGSASNVNQTSPCIEESPVLGTSQHLVVGESKYPNRKISFGKQTLKKEYKKINLTTHVIDSTKGLPVAGLQVCVYKLMDGKWTFLNESITNVEGRCNNLVDKVNCPVGRYKIHYDVDKYFSVRKIDTLFPFIEIIIDAKNPSAHYHLPLLLSPFGYTTYRGS